MKGRVKCIICYTKPLGWREMKGKERGERGRETSERECGMEISGGKKGTLNERRGFGQSYYHILCMLSRFV